MISNYNNLVTTTVEGFDSVNLLFNLEELSHQLEIIEEAISLARVSVPSSRLLSLQELVAAQQTLQNSGLTSDATDSILDIASAYILHSPQSIVYVLKIPKVTAETFTLFYIEPIILNGTRIHLSSKYYLKGPDSFSLKTPCPQTRGLYICSTQQLEKPINCIKQLFNGEPAQCSKEKTYGNNFIKKVDDFNIVANHVNTTINSNCSAHSQQLQGSYLIQISNCSITLNNDVYTNSQMEISVKPFISTTGLKVTSTKLIDRIPLEYLQELNVQQREHIKHLNLTTENIHGSLHLFGWLSSGSLTLTVIIAVGLAVVWILGGRIPAKHPVVIADSKTKENKEEEAPETSMQHRIVMIPQI